MNKKQKSCLWIGILAIVLMGIFPPWQYIKPVPSNRLVLDSDAGYAPIFKPPPHGSAFGTIIDIRRLAVQWIIVVIFFGGFVVTFKSKS